MIINVTKWKDFAFIVASGLFCAFVGYYAFKLDIQFGFFVGIILAGWHSIYDNVTGIYFLLSSMYNDEDDEIDPPEEGVIELIETETLK